MRTGMVTVMIRELNGSLEEVDVSVPEGITDIDYAHALINGKTSLVFNDEDVLRILPASRIEEVCI